MIVDDVMVVSVKEQKYEHVSNNDVEWIVDLATSHHVFLMKGLFTMYKVGDFGTVKMGILVTQKLWELVMCALKPMLVAL